MTIDTMPAAEVAIDPPLVRALLREQHSDLADLPLVDAGEGWDNRMFRLGDELAVRLPRRQAAAILIEQEQRWLPQIAARLPLPVPVPLRTDRPGCSFPWAWSIVRWLDGSPASGEALKDPAQTALQLGAFLRALHQPAPTDAPFNPYRGVPLEQRSAGFSARVQQLQGQFDVGAARAAWERAMRTPAWGGPQLWIHGDLHPGNLLVTGGRLSAVIDFGDLSAGDPATDLAAAWMLLSKPARTVLRASLSVSSAMIDDSVWRRARGWALHLGLAYLTRSRDNEAMGMTGRKTILSVLQDEND